MTQAMVVDVLPALAVQVTGLPDGVRKAIAFMSGAQAVVPVDAGEAFSLALQQALLAIQAGVSLDDVFRLPDAAAASAPPQALAKAVALENLAAGKVPQQLLDLVASKFPAFAQTPVPQDATAPSDDVAMDVETLLEYVASLLAPLAAAGAVADQAPPANVVMVAPDSQQTPVDLSPTRAGGPPAVVAGSSEPLIGQTPQTMIPQVPEAVPEDAAVVPQENAPVSAPAAETPVSDGSGKAVETPQVPQPQYEQVAVQAVKASVPKVGLEKPPAVPGAESPQAEPLRPVAPQPAEILALVEEQSGVNAGSVKVPAPFAAEGPPQDAKPAILKNTAVPPAPSAQAGADVSQDQPAARGTSVVAPPDAVLAQAPVQAAAVEAPLARMARVGRALSGDDLAANGLQAVQTDAAGKAAEVPPRVTDTLAPDQERLIARIAGAISQAERAGRTTVRIRLYPPEMGTVKIEVTSHRGAVNARIEVSTPATHGVLQSNLAALRADLRQAGVDIRDMQVQYRDPATAFGPQDRSAGRGAQEERRFAKRQAQTEQTQPVESVPAYSDVGWTGSLNVFV